MKKSELTVGERLILRIEMKWATGAKS